MNDDRGGADLLDRAEHEQVVAKPGRLQVADVDVGNIISTATGPQDRALVDADMAREAMTLQAGQVKRDLGVQALSIANGQPRIILSLFQ